MTTATDTKQSDNPGQIAPVVLVPLVDHAGGEWQKWRAVVEANLATATVEQKAHYNVWDDFGEVIRVLRKMAKGEWEWYRNSRCKYIEVRIDMRSGHCILRDQNGQRINPSDLAHQVA